jgi:hypothetical protein
VQTSAKKHPQMQKLSPKRFLGRLCIALELDEKCLGFDWIRMQVRPLEVLENIVRQCGPSLSELFEEAYVSVDLRNADRFPNIVEFILKAIEGVAEQKEEEAESARKESRKPQRLQDNTFNGLMANTAAVLQAVVTKEGSAELKRANESQGGIRDVALSLSGLWDIMYFHTGKAAETPGFDFENQTPESSRPLRSFSYADFDDFPWPLPSRKVITSTGSNINGIVKDVSGKKVGSIRVLAYEGGPTVFFDGQGNLLNISNWLRAGYIGAAMR